MSDHWTAIMSTGQFLVAREEPRGHFTTWRHDVSGVAIQAWAGPSNAASMQEFFEGFYGATYGPWVVAKAELGPGEYVPRVQRERLPGAPTGMQAMPPMRALHSRAFAASRASASNLFSRLDEMFRYVEPATRNAHAYGDQLRSLLILAATEVESAWKAVLHSNGGLTPEARATTREYVELALPMRLAEYSVRLNDYPDYPRISPFRTWSPASPTQSLAWYDAYNAVKHNREGLLHRATLEHSLSAVCALYVMLVAQFGSGALAGERTLAPWLALDAMPAWDTAQWYVPPLSPQDAWVPRMLFAQPLR